MNKIQTVNIIPKLFREILQVVKDYIKSEKHANYDLGPNYGYEIATPSLMVVGTKRSYEQEEIA